MFVTTYKNQAGPDFHSQLVPESVEVKQQIYML